MTAVRTIRRSFTVGRHRATLTVQTVAGVPAGIEVAWDSDHPPRLSGADLARYRTLRNAILKSVANELGAGILVLDAEPDGSWTPNTIQPEVAG